MSLSDIQLCVACGKPLSPGDGSQYHRECLAAGGGQFSKPPECIGLNIECPICGSTGPDDCGHGEQVADWGKPHLMATMLVDDVNAVRLQFRNAGKPVFSIYPDNRVELHDDSQLDEASHLFWEAVKHAAPRPVEDTDNDEQLARVKVVLEALKTEPSG